MNGEKKERAEAGQPMQDETELPYTPAITGETADAGFDVDHWLLPRQKHHKTGALAFGDAR